jgi:hypothetical protein
MPDNPEESACKEAVKDYLKVLSDKTGKIPSEDAGRGSRYELGGGGYANLRAIKSRLSNYPWESQYFSLN